jgi:hypothetical protein
MVLWHTLTLELPLKPEDLRFIGDQGWAITDVWKLKGGVNDGKLYLCIQHLDGDSSKGDIMRGHFRQHVAVA